MMRLRLSGLRVRLALVVLIAVVPALALILYTGFEQRRAVAEEWQDDLLRLARVAALEQSNLIEGARHLLVGLAQFPEVLRREGGPCSARFSSILKAFPSYAILSAAKPSGEVFCSGVPLPGPVTLADRPFFQRALRTQGLAVSEYVVGWISDKAVIALAYPAVDESGSVRAVTVLGVDLRWLNHLAAEARLPAGSTLTVLDRKGLILARYPSADDLIGRAVPDRAVTRAILGGGGEGTFDAKGLDGVPRLYAFTRVPTSPESGDVYISIGSPSAVVFAEVHRMLVRNLVGLGLVGALALMAAWFAANRLIVRQVNAVLAATGRLGAGDLSARSGPPYGSGELGRLAQTFDEMAVSLETRAAAMQRTADALRETNETLRELIETSPVGIISVDPDGTVKTWSPAAEGIFGWTADEVLRRPVPFASQDSEKEFRALLGRALSGERLVGIEARRLKKDGSPVDISVFTGPQRDGEGRVTGVIAIVADITARKRAEEMLRQSEKLAAMGELLAGVAHELNNPLSVVMGYAALLRHSAGEGPMAARAEKIEVAADRCCRIVRNFLALARQYPPERREALLNELVQGAVELVAYQLRVADMAVTFDLAEDLPRIWADPHQLQEVVVNLVTNAYHAMRGTPPPHGLILATRYDADRARVTLEVADTGPGIPPEIQGRIFDPFFTTKPPGQGTGLGLSLCRGVVEGHGGVIRAESRPGQGATFVVELPLGQAPMATLEADSPEAPPAFRGKKILVVDDEQDVATLLADILRADGHQVETALNGMAALEKLRAHTYDLIVSDLRMPVLDGPGLYRELERSRPELLQRMVFMTGDTLNQDTRAFFEARRPSSFSKPFDIEEIWRVVRRVLGTPS